MQFKFKRYISFLTIALSKWQNNKLYELGNESKKAQRNFLCFIQMESRFSYTRLLSTLNLQNIRTTSRTYGSIFSIYLKAIKLAFSRKY